MYKYCFKRILIVAILGVAMNYTAKGQEDLSRPLSRDTTVTVGRLSNGLTYYIKPNSKPAQKVELRLVVRAGSILENDDQQGLAHFMEHMEFNGLKHYPKNELVDYLQKIGVRFGADLNANTGWDRTYFILPIPTDNPGNLKQGFQIMGDWADGALINTNEVNEERHVILEELRMRNKNARTRMMKKFLPMMLNKSRYAYRLPGGKDSIVQYANPDLIRQFYHDWYRPDLMAVIVVGDITVPQAKALIEKYFAHLKNPVDERDRRYYHVTPYTTRKATVVSDSEATGYEFTLMYPAHRVKIEKTVEDFRQKMIRNIFIQTLNRKFRDMTQVSAPPFTAARISLSGNIGAITLQDEGLELDVMPVDDLRTSVDAAIGELINIARFGFKEADIQPVKKNYLSAYENAYQERNTTPSADYTGSFVTNFMKGTPLTGIVNEYQYVKELLPTITVADVNVYAKKILSPPKDYFTMVTGPTKGKIQLPTEQGLLHLVEKAYKQRPKQTTEQALATNLLQREPAGGRIISERKDSVLGAFTYTLNNGIKVTIKPTDFQKDQVLLSGVKYGGTNLYGVKDKSNTTFLPDVVSVMGYGQFTPTALSDYLSGKEVRVGIGINRISDEVSGSSSVKDIPTLLKLTYLELTAPRKDTALLKGWYDKVEARLPMLRADPQNAFRDTLFKVMYENNPLSPIVIPTQQDMNHIDVNKILTIYKEQFDNADGFHFFLVGNIDTASIKPLIKKYLASLPVKETKPAYKDNGLRMVNGDKTFRFYKGTDQKSLIVDMYHGDVQYSPELALRADMLAQAMTIEVLDTIREKLQWIYSGQVSASVIKLPYGHYSITAQLPCGPENVNNILKELKKEVEGFKTNGVSDNDLEKVKKAMIEQYREGIKQNKTWLEALEKILFWGEDKKDFLLFEQRVNKVTGEDLKYTANKLLGSDHFTAIYYPVQNRQ